MVYFSDPVVIDLTSDVSEDEDIGPNFPSPYFDPAHTHSPVRTPYPVEVDISSPIADFLPRPRVQKTQNGDIGPICRFMS